MHNTWCDSSETLENRAFEEKKLEAKSLERELEERKVDSVTYDVTRAQSR